MKGGKIHSLLAGLTGDFLLPFECLVIAEQACAENPQVASAVILMVLREWCLAYVGLFP